MSWQRRWFCIAAFLGVSLARAAAAQPLPATTLIWDCVQRYDEQFHVRCLPSRREVDPSVTQTPGLAPAPQAVRQGRGGALRPVAQRGDAAVFAAQAWRVPLYALPLGGALANELLHAVLGGRVAACEIRYAVPELRANGYGRRARRVLQ